MALYDLNSSMNGRLYRFALLCAAVLIAPIPSNSAVPITTDALWWANLPAQEQRVAVEAAISSYESGFGAGISAAMVTLHDAGRLSNSDWSAFATSAVQTAYKKGRIRYSHTYDFYVSAVTDFYSLHTDRPDIRLGDVVACLADSPYYTCNSLAKLHPPTSP